MPQVEIFQCDGCETRIEGQQALHDQEWIIIDGISVKRAIKGKKDDMLDGEAISVPYNTTEYILCRFGDNDPNIYFCSDACLDENFSKLLVTPESIIKK